MITDFPSVQVVKCIQEYAKGTGFSTEGIMMLYFSISIIVIGIVLLVIGFLEDELGRKVVGAIFVLVGAGSIYIYISFGALQNADTPAIYEVTISDDISTSEYSALTDDYDLSGPNQTPIGETWTATQKLN